MDIEDIEEQLISNRSSSDDMTNSSGVFLEQS